MSQLQKPSSEHYLRDANRDEITLARAKFGVTVAMPTFFGESTPLTAEPSKMRGTVKPGMHRLALGGPALLPKWRREWSAAGPLATELGLAIVHDLEEGTVSVGAGARRRNVTEAYTDHPTPDDATRAAIVRSAIAELEARAGQ
jgi:hypothetical protein